MSRVFTSVTKFVLPVLGVLPCTSAGVTAEPPVQVVASIAPLASIVRRVGANHVSVTCLVRGNSDPHTFELRPTQAADLNRAELVVFNGLGIEFWAQNLDSSLERKLAVFSRLLSIERGDPHVWLNPQNIPALVDRLKAELCLRRAAACPEFESNAANFKTELARLDAEIAKQVGEFRHKSFVAYHPAWGRFADRYHLTQLAALRSEHIAEVKPGDLIRLVQMVKRDAIAAIFVDPYASKTQLEPLLAETGLRVVELDELGDEGEDYLELMRRNVAAMSQVMR